MRILCAIHWLRISFQQIQPRRRLATSAAGKGQTRIARTRSGEDDASIATGALSINTNRDLLRTVRERNPDAFIVFKPHPDVLVGNRKGAVSADDVAKWADCQALDADIIQCIQHADELHTMTSLSGFAALLHGKKVFWLWPAILRRMGLTHDEHCTDRRTRRSSLTDLVWQALIAYPTYIHPQRLEPMAVEEAVQWLRNAPRGEMNISSKAFDRLIRQYRKLQMLYKSDSADAVDKDARENDA